MIFLDDWRLRGAVQSFCDIPYFYLTKDSFTPPPSFYL